jgi:cytochrome c biogenesis protein CcdA
MKTDCASIVVAHIILGLTVVASLVATLRAVWRSRRGGVSAVVERGEASMNALYVLYGFATVALTLAIDVSECASGNKTTLVLLDYAGLTYLFFFSGWFRNRVVFRALQRMRRD